MRSGILLLYLTLAVISLTHCDAERSMRLLKGQKHGRTLTHKHTKMLRKIFKHFDLTSSLDSLNAQPYSVASSSLLPPYESLAPLSLPEKNPPFCLYPPSSPSTSNPTPTGYQLSPPVPPAQNPPSSSPGSRPTPTPESVPGPSGNIPNSPIQNPPIIIPGPPGSLPTPTPESIPSPPGNIPGSPPIIIPSPPGTTTNPPSTVPSPTGGTVPGSPEPVQNPPIILPGPPGSTTIPSPSPPNTIPSPIGGSVPGSPEPIQNPPIILPGPPGSETSPPTNVPSPSGATVPSPTVFEPPVVFPPPSVPPPPYPTAPSGALWCVAKPSVPDPIIQEAMNYACGSGADCDSIQPNGPCFDPDTVLAHASYAFNSYWQSSKAAGAACDFGGTGMLVSVDPSYDGCHFVYMG